MSPQSQNQPEINDELDGDNLINQTQKNIAPKTLKLVTEFGSTFGGDFTDELSDSSEEEEDGKNYARQVPSEVVEDLETKEDNSLAPLTSNQKESGVVCQSVLVDNNKYEQEIEALRQLLFGSEVANLRQENQELHRKVNQLEEKLNNPEQLKYLLAPVILDALRKEASLSSQKNVNNGLRENRTKSPSQASNLKPPHQQQEIKKKTVPPSTSQSQPVKPSEKEVIETPQQNLRSQPKDVHKSVAQPPLNQPQEVKKKTVPPSQSKFIQPSEKEAIETPQQNLRSQPKNKHKSTAQLPLNRPQEVSPEIINDPQISSIQPSKKSRIEAKKNKLRSQATETRKNNLDNQPVNQLVPEETNTQSSVNINKKKRSVPILPWILFSLLALGGSVFIVWRMYTERILERRINLAFDSNTELAIYKLKADVRGKNLVLNGVLPSTLLRSQAEEFTQKIANNKQVYNDIIVVEPSPAQVATQVERVLAMFNQIEGINLKANVQDRTVTLEGNALQLADLNAVTEAFGEIPGVKNVNNKVTNLPSSIATRVYFGNSSAELVLNDARVKILPIKQLMLKYPTLKLKIIGHSHESEGEDNLQELALERAQAVQLVLEDQGIDRRRTEAVGIVGSPDEITSNQPIWLSRCVLFEIIK